MSATCGAKSGFQGNFQSILSLLGTSIYDNARGGA